MAAAVSRSQGFSSESCSVVIISTCSFFTEASLSVRSSCILDFNPLICIKSLSNCLVFHLALRFWNQTATCLGCKPSSCASFTFLSGSSLFSTSKFFSKAFTCSTLKRRFFSPWCPDSSMQPSSSSPSNIDWNSLPYTCCLFLGLCSSISMQIGDSMVSVTVLVFSNKHHYWYATPQKGKQSTIEPCDLECNTQGKQKGTRPNQTHLNL
ncbi:hypothetical protein Ahy_B03g062289 [Arachis hypogaea]|uniref:Uncharacterized protein n=1 Tax=Arachis hypogaea TaxID=3818 RepID=A0A444ZU51_ARAHY|nr:hypothetical protein Ahy_B03g062289 [Arachis hypogaea]